MSARAGEPVDAVQVLLEYWRDQRAQARQCEDQRAAMTNFLLLLAAAAVAFVSQLGLVRQALPATGLLALLGCFGMAASAKYYERYRVHTGQAVRLSELLAEHTGAPSHDVALEPARIAQRAAGGWLARVQLRHFWLTLHALIGSAGLTLSVVIMAGAGQ